MIWKKALFFGGAVLLLAACDRATAPNALAIDGGAASLVAKPASKGPPPTVKAGKIGKQNMEDPNCSGYLVSSGLNGDTVRVCLSQ